ncbi:hypothetical protein [Candidatus Parabeggiatoa sp. HSG14]|uniref:hypothetical protein n=1 Tax=Candidatus Parabeggiatoa sp. HSG14 TaxID=3055593 RepID=UPI0025A7EB6D|nr:hypothetical protein [Thiotrichales bacterium HSG14]
MTIVFRAVSQSSMSVVEQMLWVIEIESESDYDLCSGSDVFWEQAFSKADWSNLADTLLKRLKSFSSKKDKKEDFNFRYQHDKTIELIIEALEKSDRKSEVIPLCQNQVAQSSEGYPRLISHLRNEKRVEDAIEWIHKGIVTHEKYQNITIKLRNVFLELKKEAKNWPQVAALEADEFFNRPSLHTFQALEKAAKRAKVLPTIRTAALQFLETGQSPLTAKTTKMAKSVKNAIWPLPKPEAELPKERFSTDFPKRNTLIEIAIAEKQPDEVMRWYQPPDTKPSRFGGGWSNLMVHQVASVLKVQCH